MSSGGMGGPGGIGAINGVDAQSILGNSGVKNAGSVAGSQKSTAFASVLIDILNREKKSSSAESAEQIHDSAEIDRLANRYINLVGIFGAGGEYGGQSIEELGKSLQDDISNFTKEFGSVASGHGLQMASFGPGRGILFMAHGVDLSNNGPINSFARNGKYLDSNFHGIMNGYLDGLEDGERRARNYRAAYSEKREEWQREMEILAARSAFVQFAQSDEKFAEQFRLSPEKAIGKYITQIDAAMNKTSVLYKNGQASYHTN